MEVIGTVGAVIGVVDVLGRSIHKIYDIRTRLKDAPFTLARLFGELTAAKIALSQLQASLEKIAHNDLHYDLVMDLDSSLSCCHSLVLLIDSKIPDSNVTDLAVKIQVILADEETTKCLECLSRTLLALNIVRESLQSDNISTQYHVVHQPQNRQVLDQVRDDSTSLIVLRDSASFDDSSRLTISSYRSSQLSLRFPGLDDVLMQHKVYQSTFRSLIRRLKRAKGRSQSDVSRTGGANVAEEKNTVPAGPSLPPCILVSGDNVLSHSFTIYAALSSNSKSDYAERIRTRIRSLMVLQVIQVMSVYLTKIERSQTIDHETSQTLVEIKEFLVILRELLQTEWSLNMNSEIIVFSGTLMTMLKVFDEGSTQLPFEVNDQINTVNFSSRDYFLRRLPSALAPDYRPSEGDILYASLASSALGAATTAHLSRDAREYSILSWPNSEDTREAYVNELNSIQFEVFVVDLLRIENGQLLEVLAEFEKEMSSVVPILPIIVLFFHTGNLDTRPPPHWIEFISNKFGENVPAYFNNYYIHVLDISDTDLALERIQHSRDEFSRDLASGDFDGQA